MSVERKRRLLVFHKLDRQLSKLASRQSPEDVHKFRTSSRRVETVLEEGRESANHKPKKLLKALARLRKKAGRVRDLDVQIAALRNLKVPEAAAHKSQLLGVLAEQRMRGEKKVVAAFDRGTVRELRKRLKRAAASIEIPEGRLLSLAKARLRNLAQPGNPLSEKTLHHYRIVGKRARYLAELSANHVEAARLVKQLKRMQDVIGDWHDWLKLTEKTEELFGGVQESPLVAALRNVTRAKFRHALDVLAETRSGLARKKPVVIESVASRGPETDQETDAAVA
jgi:CHAD domain-containing protein